ncbi:MAG TPA: TraB/GumN family protein [Brevundimonas sp.]
MTVSSASRRFFKAASIKKLARTAVGAALGLALVAALVGSWAGPAFAQATSAPVVSAISPAAGDGPALWVVKDVDSTIYLFGTIHVLRPETRWESAEVTAAFNSALDIWFEISNPDDMAALIPLIKQYGVSPGTPLSSLLTPAELNELNAAAQTIGASAAQLDVFRPWYAGLTLSLAPLKKAGYDPNSGVELTLKKRAEAAGKPIHGFETLDKQVRLLANLPQDIQLEFLRSTLRDFDDAGTELDAMVAAWAAGDVAALDRVTNEDMKAEAPDIYKALLTDRNTGFADQIQTLLAGSGTAFVAVGAAHLAGDDSVQSMLSARGVEVSRE